VISAEKLAALVESLGAIVWEADGRTFQFTFVGGRAEAILGFPISEWLNDPQFWRKHTHPDDVERCTTYCLDATRRGRDHQFEYRMIAADGRVVWLRDTVTVKEAADGSPLLTGVMLDITDKKADEERIKRLERFGRALLENSSDNIAVIRRDGVTTYQSEAVERQLGYKSDDLVGQNNFHLIHPDDRESATRRMVDILSSDDVVGPIRFRGIHKDGHVVVLESLGKRFEDEGEVFAIINTRDITQQARLEAQLAQAMKMEALGQLAGGVAHDFNNLLTVITGYTETVREMLGPDDAHAREVEEIRRAADRAAVLTSQLLAFSRKQVLKAEIQDLNEVVRDVGSMIGRVIGATIELQLELASERALVVADRGQMEQVLLNLAVNARDAMPYGGTLKTRTSTATVDGSLAAQRPPLTPGKYVVLEVIDSGSGMSSDVQRHVFEPFFTTKDPGKGTGLGLSTVYGIVKQSRGFVFVDSELGRGTSFTIYLPLAEGHATEPAAQSVSTVAPGRETVLLVEDERMVRDLAKQVLSRQGYHVLTAQNGNDALEVCRDFAGTIELLVTDIVMAGMSGPDLARRLESASRVGCVLYISGYAGDAVLERSGERGVAFLQKPFTPTALARKVREVLDHRADSR
jgi:PAS domain S-box-containing protein